MPTRLLLVAVSVASTLLLIEFVAFPFFLDRLPIKLHIYLDEGIRPLAQSSKRATIPRDYIALVGDSYAQGRGDWLLSCDPDTNPPFHSAHLIHERTGRDVLSFARSGVGSIRGIATEPVAKFRYLESSWLFELDPPDELLIYLYEGNDFHDNLLELGVLFRVGDAGEEASRRDALGFERLEEVPAIADLSDARLYESTLFQHLIEASALAGHDLAEFSWAPLRNLFFLRLLASTIIGEARGTWEELPADHHDVVWPAFPPKLQRAGHTIVRIDGTEHDITRELQAADPDMSDLETDAVIHMLEQSLLLLRDHFPGAGMCVVYIPSPAASYEIVSDTMNLAVGWTLGEYSTVSVLRRSDELRRLVREMIAANDIDYLDATDAVRAASRQRVLHGPLDWRHFNREGYQVLADVALRCPQLSIRP